MFGSPTTALPISSPYEWGAGDVRLGASNARLEASNARLGALPQSGVGATSAFGSF
jgi:hypothetical protein